MPNDLAEYRIRAGYKTQDALSKIVGVGRNTISRWESGTREPSLTRIKRLAQILGVTEGDIIAAITNAKQDTA